ncbi:MAG TPA: EAL domain-containing protein [Candidatus Acidoferrum sp.]|nr:EAL domain-containing protein [Candidatus Acidoferrum sp.]
MNSPAPSAVLVVDDDNDTRGLVMFALQRAGFIVIGAESGEAGLDIIRKEPIGLVVLDMGMPGMSGTDVVRVLRSRASTATLPILLMTGSGDQYSVISGLDAGADDFLPKPVRLDELVARVNAHLRKQATWSTVVEDELRTRTSVVAALAHLTISSVPEEAAEAVIRELAERTNSDFVGVQQVGAGGQLHELATYNHSAGVRRGGHALSPAHSLRVLARAREGPWVEEVEPLRSGERTTSFESAALGFAVGAPIYRGDDLVGLLTIGVSGNARTVPLVRRSKLLAAAIDYAAVLSTIAGPAFAYHRDLAATRARLRRVLTAGEFSPVFQPIVELETRTVVGFEALTRFADGTAPDVRFEEAAGMGLGSEYELATIRAALRAASALPDDVFLSINVSPGLVLSGDRRFRKLLAASTRALVLELTEHVPIDDYGGVRTALSKLGDVGLAVDDAGAGFSSFRHILELRPTYAKLDISLVRGIDGDDLRQALAAGLQYFADRTGCRLIAEGVESAAEAEVLQRLGVEYGQGYLLGRPAPIH